MKQEGEYSIRVDSSTQDHACILDQRKWLNMAYNLIQKENVPLVFKLDALEKNFLKGDKTFDYFIIRLKQWNAKATNNLQYNPKDQQIFKFVYSHLKMIIRKSANLQKSLLQNLLNWYQQNINPKPKISEILKTIKRKKTIFNRGQQEVIRKTFNSNLSLKVNDFYRRQFGATFNDHQMGWKNLCVQDNGLLDQKIINRIKRRQEENIRSWRQQKQISSRIKLMTECRTRRQCKAYQGMSSFRSMKHYKKGSDLEQYVKNQTSRSPFQFKKPPNIGGLTLISNPFEGKSK